MPIPHHIRRSPTHALPKPLVAAAAWFVAHPFVRNASLVVGGLTAVTAVGRLLFLHSLDVSIIIMLYLLTVILVSRFATGYVAGVVASILSVFLFNFFFTEPYFSLAATDPKYPLIFLIMLAVSMLTSATTIEIRRTAEERVRLARLQESTQREFEAERLRSTILRSISHDLRTPLTGISGAASVLLEDAPDLTPEDRKRMLSDIYAESIWLGRFVENMLILTRIDDHLLKLQPNPQLVEELIGEAVNLARRRLGASVRIEVDVPEESVVVDVDASLIEEVLLNLIDNAASHSPQGRPIEVGAHFSEGRAVFHVRDHGPGIVPEEVEKVFDRYFVGSEPRTDARRGQGIGLSICRTIVEAHHGELSFRNRDDGGAEFLFSLPARKEGP